MHLPTRVALFIRACAKDGRKPVTTPETATMPTIERLVLVDPRRHRTRHRRPANSTVVEGTVAPLGVQPAVEGRRRPRKAGTRQPRGRRDRPTAVEMGVVPIRV